MRAFECLPGTDLTPAAGAALMETIQSGYTAVNALHGTFRQESYLAALDAGEVSSGEMWFGKPGKMRWAYKEPTKQIVVIRDGTLWMYQADKGQVLIDDIGEVLLTDLPVAFLTGLGSLTRDFELKKACRSVDGTVLKLVPRSTGAQAGKAAEREELQGFDLLVDAGQALPTGARVTSLGGNITAIQFETLETAGVKVAPSTFVLEYPKGVDIMDRRISNPR
jgi:outer membrane lipoprotein carrier protein